MEQNLFDNIGVSEEVQRAVAELGYTEMTAIQTEAIPAVLAGRDVVGRSGTGTGKTAAFGVPIVQMCIPENRQTQVLILCPTRELAMQISGELRKYAKYKPGVNIATVYGGDSMVAQFRQLKYANIVVGTPGRVMDHMRRGTLKLETVRTVVLDEADEMLNMGFLEDIDFILAAAPEERQTLLFSATMPGPIMKLTERYQHDPLIIAADGGRPVIDNISQYYYYVSPDRKEDALNLLLQAYGEDRAIVFCNTKKKVDELVEYLNDHGFGCTGIHGDMKQSARIQVMHQFKSGRLPVLVATDVAARGIDVYDIKAVFNFDIPMENEYYIHRIGRTGRAKKLGSSHTLVANRLQLVKLRELEKLVKREIVQRPIPGEVQIGEAKAEKTASLIRERVGQGSERFTELADRLLLTNTSTELVAALLSMLPSGGSLILPGDIASIEQPLPQPKAATGGKSSGKYDMLVTLNVGKKQGISPRFIIDLVTKKSKIPSRNVNSLKIADEKLTFEVSAEDAQRVQKAMDGFPMRSRRVEVGLEKMKANSGGGGFRRRR